jgi:hypothetical protein
LFLLQINSWYIKRFDSQFHKGFPIHCFNLILITMLATDFCRWIKCWLCFNNSGSVAICHYPGLLTNFKDCQCYQILAMAAPWWVSMAVFGLSAMANFCRYSDMIAPHGRILALHHRLHCLNLCFYFKLTPDL